MKTDVLEKSQQISQIIVSWIIPIFGSLFVLHILVSTDTECLESKWLIWPFRSIVFGKKIRTSTTSEDDYWAIENGGNHRGKREIESNHSESADSD